MTEDSPQAVQEWRGAMTTTSSLRGVVTSKMGSGVCEWRSVIGKLNVRQWDGNTQDQLNMDIDIDGIPTLAEYALVLTEMTTLGLLQSI